MQLSTFTHYIQARTSLTAKHFHRHPFFFIISFFDFSSHFFPLSGGSFSSNNDAIRIRYSGVVLLNKKVFDMGTTTDEGENRTPPRICFLPADLARRGSGIIWH